MQLAAKAGIERWVTIDSLDAAPQRLALASAA